MIKAMVLGGLVGALVIAWVELYGMMGTTPMEPQENALESVLERLESTVEVQSDLINRVCDKLDCGGA